VYFSNTGWKGERAVMRPMDLEGVMVDNVTPTAIGTDWPAVSGAKALLKRIRSSL